MDDGFQHLRLRRDLDVVLVDATRPWGLGYCLPRGLLREPPAALRDADCVVITRSDAADAARLAALRERIARLAPRASLHAAVHAPSHVLDAAGRRRPVEDLAGRAVLAVCGLANPAAFFATLEGVGVRLAGRLALDDHVAYTPEVLGRVAAARRQCGAELIVTTDKDETKLPAAGLDRPAWTLAVRMRIVDGEEPLRQRILSTAKAQPTT
jgi:tetraacyldisaccharide 4'-kinase